MEKIIWVCTGGCNAKKTQEEYGAGKIKCGNPQCANYGKPFEKMRECLSCRAVMKENEEHACDAC